jgi:hypothetical protein
MNEHQQQLQKQLWRLPEPLSLTFDPPRSFTVSLGTFFVYVDYHKRKGLKLCSTVFTFPDGLPDAEVRAFLKAWAKTKHDGGRKLEWGGDDEVLFIQEFPKNIIDDDKLAELDQAITSFRESLISLQQKMIELNQKSRSVSHVLELGTVVEKDDFQENASLEHSSGRSSQQEKRPSRRESWKQRKESRSADTAEDSEGLGEQVSTDQRKYPWQLRRNSQESTKERMQNNSEEASADSSEQNAERKNFLGFGRRKKKESPFVPLDDDYFSDDGANCVVSATSGLPGL